VQQKRLVATIKIIPFAAPLSAVNAAVQRFAQLLKVRPFKRLKIALIQTELPVANKHLLDKTAAVTVQRLANMENTLCGEWRCAHQQEAVTDTLNIVRREISPDLYLIAGASAVCDQADVVPASITAAGGIVTRFGMPTDPGNLLVLATFHGASCIVLPGCARSPKLNGFDWVLARLLAGIETTANDIAAMGVGGLLEDIVDRPVRRTLATKPIIGGILLAAGLSTRMGKTNKLLAPWHEKPLVSHAAHTLIAAHEAGLIQTVVAVCGHEVDTVQAAIGNLLVTHNPDFSQGMASSLRCGLQALTATKNVDGVLVVLGDMPAVTIDDIAAVIAAFDGNNIVVPTHNSKRGNPVLIGRQHFAALEQLQGDTGARALFADSVITEAPASAGVLFDIDSPSALETDK
jgi:molybdenum cofactor cytidylyltransferase